MAVTLNRLIAGGNGGTLTRYDLQCCRIRVARQRDAPSRATPEKYGWQFGKPKPEPGQNNVEELPLRAIKRPLQGTRTNDREKVEALMESIKEIGLQTPIDVLLVEDKYYGFSGCHRYEACQRLGKETILAKVAVQIDYR